MDERMKQLNEYVIDGDMDAVINEVQTAVDDGISADVILHEGLIPAMDVVGRLFEDGEYFVPEMLVSARAMQGGLNLLKPLLVAGDVEPAGKVVIGTIQGDLHDIGKNLVAMMLEGAGFSINDLGVNVSPAQFVEAAKDFDANIVCMSALLTTTMPNMSKVVDSINEAGLHDRVRIMIGGAPVTQEYAEKIGADGYSKDASAATRLAKKLVAELGG
jgi:5-methyltetrahydrofolate--homocysteine methyltransferase